jgi:hypothetical protein
MPDNYERRTEQRLRYQWPIWFAENKDCEITQGQMVDISSKSAAFNCYNDRGHQYIGQHILSRFSIPRYDTDDSFDIMNFTRWGQICRIENINPFMRRIAIRFSEPLPIKPGEQAVAHAFA